MFEKFTDRARRVVVLAQEEARELSHSYIGTEHILLGLLREEEGFAGLALRRHGLDLPEVRAKVKEIIGQGATSPTGHIPFTPRAKKVLEISFRESLRLGHSYIGTEHILLGLVREGEGVGAQVLTRLGVTHEALRETLLGLLSAGPEEREATIPPLGQPGRTRPCTHPFAQLVYRPFDLPGQGDLPTISVSVVTCSNCDTTIGVLPA